MLKQVLKMAAIGMFAFGLMPGAGAQSVTAVPKLDLNQFVGKWYEIARLPNKQEKNCVSDVVLLYALADKANQFQIVNACEIKNGNSDTHNGSGSRPKKSEDGKLKVSYIWPLTTKHWVLATGPSYEWVLVGSPNHKTLWVLSRTATMQPDVLAEIQAKATSEGFNISKMVTVSQRH